MRLASDWDKSTKFEFKKYYAFYGKNRIHI